MNRGTTQSTIQDNRRFGRYPLNGNVYFETDGERGSARCADVGRGGLSIILTNPLPEGSRIRLEVSAPGGPAPAPEFKGKVTWCQASEYGAGYEAGIRVYHDDMDAVAGLSALLHAGLAQAGLMDRVYATLKNCEADSPGNAFFGRGVTATL
ncbi:MAG: hypothetical protein AMXMBFR84_04950 [Candidatus Hydrogenedentota bacterium]